MFIRELYVTAGLLAANGILASNIPSRSPEFSCGAHAPTDKLLQSHQKLAHVEEIARRSSIVKHAKIDIDLYVSIVAKSETNLGDLSDRKVKDQVAVLNADYKPAGISFNLRDIDRTVNATWALGGSPLDMKAELRKGGKGDLNLYFMERVPGGSGNAKCIGSCSYPDSLESTIGLIHDGCMIDASTVPGDSEDSYYKGKTTTHEVGHWLGLLHTFEGGCEGDGDLIADTPASKSSSTGCPIGRDSCPDQPGLDPIHNYMDYSSDACYSEFSRGQIARMHSMWAEYRA